MESSVSYKDILFKYWGYTSFRPLQEDVMLSVSAGKDTLALMPTGGGKSITFQVPALKMEGVCIVVTPLISLMRDQVANLRTRGIGAAYLCHGQTVSTTESILLQCGKRYKFLYVSPERLQTYLFQHYLQRMTVSLLVVDECHCISQWGYDFRPAYLHIASIRPLIPHAPILALSATATPKVIEDIQEKLLFRQKNVLKSSFYRPNISFIVHRTAKKKETSLHILRRLPNAAILYVRRRKDAENVALFLQEYGISALAYHAGLSMKERNKRQNAWKKNQCKVIVATNAFGMGIDKADVRVVIHLDMPISLEAYFQEAGRAGRDGLRSYAIVLQNVGDEYRMKERLDAKYPPMQTIQKVYTSLLSYMDESRTNEQGSLFSCNEFADHMCAPLAEVYYSLCLLSDAGYIEYVRENEQEQEELSLLRKEKKVTIPPTLYEKRKKKEASLMNAALQYIWQREMCRSLFLLKYFDEEKETPCKACDTCGSFREKPLNDEDISILKETMNRHFQRGIYYEILEVLITLPYSFDKGVAAIRFLVDNDDSYVLSESGCICRI